MNFQTFFDNVENRHTWTQTAKGVLKHDLHMFSQASKL